MAVQQSVDCRYLPSAVTQLAGEGVWGWGSCSKCNTENTGFQQHGRSDVSGDWLWTHVYLLSLAHGWQLEALHLEALPGNPRWYATQELPPLDKASGRAVIILSYAWIPCANTVLLSVLVWGCERVVLSHLFWAFWVILWGDYENSEAASDFLSQLRLFLPQTLCPPWPLLLGGGGSIKL